MDETRKILEKIRLEFKNVQFTGSKARNNVARKVYPHLPKNRKVLIEIFDFLVKSDEPGMFWLVTKWIKRKELYSIDLMSYYEGWLYDHVNSWGACDIFCYRVLNPMVERYPQFFKNVKKWADSTKTYVRRAAPVSLLQSTRSFVVNCSVQKVIFIAEKLKHDKQLHVQKGVGWLLKYAYLTYPDEVCEYLKSNVENLPRVIFRYALEKAPTGVKEQLMAL